MKSIPKHPPSSRSKSRRKSESNGIKDCLTFLYMIWQEYCRSQADQNIDSARFSTPLNHSFIIWPWVRQKWGSISGSAYSFISKGLRGFHSAFVTKKALALKSESSCSIR